jgi:hypothetical protein
MTYPTISISLNETRTAKLSRILRILRDKDETVSRSEAIGQAIDIFFTHLCPSESTDVPQDERAHS